VYNLWKQAGANFVHQHLPAVAPFQMNVLDTLYRTESTLVDALLDLHKTLQKSFSAKDLDKKVKRLVDAGHSADFGRENTFFAVFDRLVAHSTQGGAPRTSALVLEITAPGKSKVTKIVR
jgi:hypothetical protein